MGNVFNRDRLPWDNPNIRVMRLSFEWGDLQTGPGRYDWSSVDYALGLADAKKVPVAITVQAGLKTHPWVYDAGAKSYTYVSPDADQGTMPLPWDSIYLKLWRGFLNALGDKYDRHPSLAYVQIQGYGKSGELFVATTEPDNTNLLELGGSTSWLSAAQSITRVAARNFPQTPIFIAFARPFLGKVGQQMMDDFSTWIHSNYPGKVGFMCNSLSTRSNTGYPPNKYVSDYTPSGFQMVGTAQDPRTGDLAQAIDNGIDMNSDGFIEVYRMDIINPEFQSVLAAANVRLGV